MSNKRTKPETETKSGLTAENLVGLNERFRGAEPEEIVRWAAETFSPDLKLATSFGVEGLVVLDIVSEVAPQIPVFTLDTGRLNEETYELMEKIRRRYPAIEIQTYFPNWRSVEKLVRSKGFYSFRDSVEARRECCRIRKVEPLRRALAGLRAWMTGVRRGQSVTRSEFRFVERDPTNGLIKINPLVDWEPDRAWARVRERGIPYNPLHDRGYHSIGCSPCTRPTRPGEDIRAGRWWWESAEQKECGIHR